VDDVLAAERTDDEGKPLYAVAYSVGGYHGPILPQPRARGRTPGAYSPAEADDTDEDALEEAA
jgi:hypothetical protein